MMRKSQLDNRKEYMLENSGRGGLRIGVRAQMLLRSVWMLLFHSCAGGGVVRVDA